MPAGIAYSRWSSAFAEVLPGIPGTGILAGDHLKSASDLGLPADRRGPYYRSGYFKQSPDRGGLAAGDLSVPGSAGSAPTAAD